MGLFTNIKGTIGTLFQIGVNTAAIILKQSNGGYAGSIAFRNKADNAYRGIDVNSIDIYDTANTRKTLVQMNTGGAGNVDMVLPNTAAPAGKVLGSVIGSGILDWVSPLVNIESTVFDENPVDKTIVLTAKASYAFTILGVRGIKTTTGTLTVAIKINGTNVTGLSAINVTSTTQDVGSTAARDVAVDDRVTFVITSSSGAENLEGTIYGVQI